MLIIQALIKSWFDAGERDIDEVASKVITEIIKAGEAEQHLFGLVRPQVVNMHRAIERDSEKKWYKAEKANDAAERRGHKSSEYRNDALKGRIDLIKREFYDPISEKMVTWGDATIFQHKAARDKAYADAATEAERGDRHARALRDCETAGVNRLIDIPGWTDESWFEDLDSVA